MSKNIIIALILTLLSTSTVNADGKIILQSYMYKEKKDNIDFYYNKNLDEILLYYDTLKQSGAWDSSGTRYNTDTTRYGNSAGDSVDKFEPNTTVIDPKFLEKNHGVEKGTKLYRSADYQKAVNEPLASKWKVIGNSKYVLTADDWINNLPSSAHAKVPDLIRGVYKACEEQAALGKKVSPDFLIAMSMLETGWGNGRLAREKNSWFSVAAYNSNPNNATGYRTPYDSAVGVIDLLTRNYGEGGRYYIEGLGPTILGINTYYCVYQEAGSGLYYTSSTWSTKIVSVLDNAARRAGKTFPRP